MPRITPTRSTGRLCCLGLMGRTISNCEGVSWLGLHVTIHIAIPTGVAGAWHGIDVGVVIGSRSAGMSLRKNIFLTKLRGRRKDRKGSLTVRKNRNLKQAAFLTRWSACAIAAMTLYR
eukprot:scaffold7210_cov63-Attheya_sp.AAC.1